MQKPRTPRRGWERRARTVPLGTYIATAGGLVVLLGAAFTAVRSADNVVTSVTDLRGAVVDLRRTTSDLAISTHQQAASAEDAQAHLRQLDAGAIATGARLDAIERYILIHPPQGSKPIPPAPQ